MARMNLLGIALLLAVMMGGCGAPEMVAPAVTPAATTELAGIKTYLTTQATALHTSTGELKAFSDRYFELASAANFDYRALWSTHAAEVMSVTDAARAAWIKASPQYEKMEGIVAGTPSLAAFDVILDAGSEGEADPENAAPFDLTLPDGRILARPGNLFGVTESTLWGTDPRYAITTVRADWNQDGKLQFGETLPDANVLKAGVDALDDYAGELLNASKAWEPSLTDAVTALVVMVPTMGEYFASWRDSRFVAGEASTQRDFVAISRLADMQDILGGLELIYAQLKPLASTVDAEQDVQIEAGLRDLRAFVADVYAQESAGRKYTPEEADLLGAEAQDRATTIAGQITQVAAQLGVEFDD